MPDTFTTTLNLTKPAASSVDWHPKLNGNFDIIDTMGPRIAALEALSGGAVAGVTKLPDGATWADLVTAYDNAPNSIAARHEIRLPPTVPIEQTAGLHWWKNVDLRGAGSASEIILRGNVSLFGSSSAILIGSGGVSIPMQGVVFSDFKYSHDRVTGGSSMRNNPLSTGDYITDVTIKNIDFQDITANCIQIWRSNLGPVRNVLIKNITCDEWYEAVVIIDGSNIDGVYIIEVSGTTSAGSPSGGTSRPQGVFIGNEQLVFGLVKNVLVSKCNFDFRPMGGNNGQTLGVTIADGNQTGQTPPTEGAVWHYDNIVIADNTVYGAEISYRMQGVRGENYGRLLVADWELDEKSGPRQDAHYVNQLHLTDHLFVRQRTGHLGGADKAAGFVRASGMFLSRADNPVLDRGDTNFAVQAWVYLQSKPAGPMVIASKWDTAGNQKGWILYWDNATDRFIFSISADGTAVASVSATTFGAPALATWYLVSADHNATTNFIKISVNDGAMNSTAHSGGAFANTAEFRIGADLQGSYWDGRLQQVRLYLNSLDAQVTGTALTKIQQIYRGGAGYTWQQLDDLGGLSHYSIVNNISHEATQEHILYQANAGDYLDISGNDCYIFPGQAGIGGDGAVVATSKPNRLFPAATFLMTDNLRSSWDFVGGSTLLDSVVATANNLTTNNAVTFGAGVVGQTANFVRASSQYLSRATNASLQPGENSFTWLVWLNMATLISAGQTAGIVTKRVGNVEEFRLIYSGDSTQFEWYISNDGTEVGTHGVSAQAFGSPSASTWYLVHCRLDARLGKLGIGVNDGAIDETTHQDGVHVGAAPLQIGAYVGANFFNGSIGPIRYYNRLLSADEISAHYNAGAGQTYAALVGW